MSEKFVFVCDIPRFAFGSAMRDIANNEEYRLNIKKEKEEKERKNLLRLKMEKIMMIVEREALNGKTIFCPDKSEFREADCPWTRLLPSDEECLVISQDLGISCHYKTRMVDGGRYEPDFEEKYQY